MSTPNGTYTRTNSFDNADGSQSWPRFHMETVEDEAASERQGRKIYRTRELVQVILPGNPHTSPVFAVTDEHRERWPKAYQSFKDGQEQAVDGIPIEEWPVLNPAHVMELKYLGFRTVEQVAAMSDLAVQRIGMGGAELREKAKAYLSDADAMALTEKLSAENTRKDAQIATLELQVQEMGRRLDQVHAEMMANKNAQPAILTMIPGAMDPMEHARQGAAASALPVTSSLGSLAAPRKPGRPRKAQEAA